MLQFTYSTSNGITLSEEYGAFKKEWYAYNFITIWKHMNFYRNTETLYDKKMQHPVNFSVIFPLHHVILSNYQCIVNKNSWPTGVVDRGTVCYTKGTGFESQVRHGCKIVHPFIRGNGHRLSGAPLIKLSTLLVLIVAKVSDLRARHWKKITR